MPYRQIVSLCTLLLCCTSSFPIAKGATKQLLLLGQKPDGHPPGTHEYVAGMKIVERLLSRTPSIQTKVLSADEPWSEGPELLREADGAVVFLSQGAAWLSNDPRRLDAFAALASRKGGLTTIHWGMGTKAVEPIDPWVKLFGGCHGGPDRRFKVVDTTLRPTTPPHPIARGVESLPVHEEFYYQLKFPKESRPEPVIEVEIEGARETIAWAWTRPDGGRSFGFSGLHYHSNWKHAAYRRLVLQGVLWTMGVEIPAEGAEVTIEPERLELAP